MHERSVEFMRASCLSLIILILLGVVHLRFGSGYWGAQPGGRWSSLLYLIQIAIFFSYLVWSIFAIYKKWCKNTLVVIISSVISTVLVGILFFTQGWKMLTTMHGMGSENLIPLIGSSMICMIFTFYISRCIKIPYQRRPFKLI